MQNETIRKAGLSRNRQVSSIAVCLLWLAASFAQAGGPAVFLVDHNQVLSPYPAAYQKDNLNKLAARSTPPVRKLSVAKVAAPAKPTVTEMIVAAKPEDKGGLRLEKVSAKEELPPLVDAILGQRAAADSSQKLRIGYGRMLADNSRTVGTKNGTLLEEPGCVYVKTTVRF